MRFLRVFLVLVLSLFVISLFFGGCGRTTTPAPETQEEAQTEESTEGEEVVAEEPEFLVWPGTMHLFESTSDGVVTLRETRPVFVLLPSPEFAQKLREDPGAELIVRDISGNQLGGSVIDINSVSVFFLYVPISTATPLQVGYRFSDGSTVEQTVTFNPATNVFTVSNAISITAKISITPIFRGENPVAKNSIVGISIQDIIDNPDLYFDSPIIDFNSTLLVDIEHPEACYHAEQGVLRNSQRQDIFDETETYSTPQEHTFSFSQQVSESDIEEYRLVVHALSVYENLSNYSYQNPPDQPFSAAMSILEEELAELPAHVY